MCSFFAISTIFRTNCGMDVTFVQVVGQSKVGSERQLSRGGGQHGDPGGFSYAISPS